VSAAGYVQLRRVARLVSGSGFPVEEQDISGEALPFFKVADISGTPRDGYLREPRSSISLATAQRLGARVLPEGTTVLPKIGAALYGNRRAMTTKPSCADNNLLAVIPARGLDPRFAYYAMSSVDVSSLALPGPVPSLDVGALSRTPVFVPSPSAQQQIAALLDCATTRIDGVVAAKERLVAVLNERWGTVLHNAASGSERLCARRTTAVPWLSDLPTHWREAQLKLVAKLGTGHTPSRSHPEWWVDVSIPWITTGEVAEMRTDRIEYITETREHISETGVANSSATVHPAGTVVLCRTASAGYSAIMGRDMATSQDFATWTCGPLLRPRFLLICLRAMRQDLLGRLAMGSTHQTIYMPDIESIKLPVPPLAEQDELVDAAHAQRHTLDECVDRLRSQIDLLRERRQSLITAAVTGQIGVPFVT
jgi:type I restriction enzyme S subunit